MENEKANSIDDDEYIYLSLLHLGAIMWNKSSKRLLLALQYVIANNTVTNGPVKCLYAELASAQNCTYSVIERSLRYAIQTLWECSRNECSILLYHSKGTVHRPCVSEFIYLYTEAFKKGIIQTWVDSLEKRAAELEKTNIDDILKMF